MQRTTKFLPPLFALVHSWANPVKVNSVSWKSSWCRDSDQTFSKADKPIIARKAVIFLNYCFKLFISLFIASFASRWRNCYDRDSTHTKIIVSRGRFLWPKTLSDVANTPETEHQATDSQLKKHTGFFSWGGGRWNFAGKYSLCFWLKFMFHKKLSIQFQHKALNSSIQIRSLLQYRIFSWKNNRRRGGFGGSCQLFCIKSWIFHFGIFWCSMESNGPFNPIVSLLHQSVLHWWQFIFFVIFCSFVKRIGKISLALAKQNCVGHNLLRCFAAFVPQWTNRKKQKLS